MPGFWSFIDASTTTTTTTITSDVAGVEYFTPTNLFIVLNLLILTILALAHFHTTATYSTHAAYDYSRTRSQQGAAAAAVRSAAVADHVGVDAHERPSEDRPIAGAGQQLHAAGDHQLVSDHDYARADLDAALAVLRHNRSVILSERLLHGDGDDDDSAHIDGAAAGSYIIADFMQMDGDGDSHHSDDDTDLIDGGRPQYYDAGAGQTSHFEIKIYKLQDQGINDHTQEDDQAPAVAAGFTMSRIESSRTVQESTLTQLQPSAAADRHLIHSIINDSEEETGKSSAEMKFSSSSETKDAEPAEIGQYARHQDESAAAAAGVDDDHDQLLDIDSILAKNGSLFRHSRPLASAHFTPRRKAAAASSTNDRPLSPLRISKPNIVKRGDTLDAIWKAICESKRNSSPFNRHHPLTLNHNNIIENEGNVHHHHHHAQSHVRNLAVSPIKHRSIKNASSKNTQFNTNAGHHESLTRPHHRVRRRREPSMAQDELNAKVESFISRFNAQIKIQREKSLLDFMEMVGRGSS